MSNNILREHGLLDGNGLKKSDKEALIDIVNAAQANIDSIKSSVITAVESKIGAVTPANTWTGVINTINNSWASGSSALTTAFSVELPFTPSMVVFHINTGAYDFLFLKEGTFGLAGTGNWRVFDQINATDCTITTNGFTIKKGAGNTFNVIWQAYKLMG